MQPVKHEYIAISKQTVYLWYWSYLFVSFPLFICTCLQYVLCTSAYIRISPCSLLQNHHSLVHMKPQINGIICDVNCFLIKLSIWRESFKGTHHQHNFYAALHFLRFDVRVLYKDTHRSLVDKTILTVKHGRLSAGVTLVSTHQSADYLAVHWSWSWHVFGQTLQSWDVFPRRFALLQMRQRVIQIIIIKQTFLLGYVLFL